MSKKKPRRKTTTAGATLETLQVIDRLEVGKPVITPSRLSAPYRVVRGRRTDSLELVYRYEEPVFDLEDGDSINLASMISAQLALNYGLFCREIRFEGSFDAADRRFLEEMARNTAREIYVKKFLEPNPFLRGSAATLAAEKRDDYLLAKLNFVGPAYEGGEPWHADPERHVVLSSGGKDSLLSFGLLRELGRPVEAYFVNESGRHWFTALNAYRHFRNSVPGTGRVWTNSDRLFAFMLRHLPFIRKDFASVRSDEYPIRLWTVAVFLFGVLPMMRKRGMGRLVIGDEYDTSVRARKHGIPHHDGLYDQSRYFDREMTRYFGRKKWGITQFSMLRSLSELLIEKVLVERYPKLQKHQTSCHATHAEGERIRPCGRCEKCRRIVGMLVALGADPRNCGYSKDQIRECLAELARSGVHQEGPAVKTLMSMLIRAGKLKVDDGVESPEPCAEVLHLRFDAERSPLDTVPADLRRPLYNLLLEHADGAMRKVGRKWTAFDPLTDPLTAPAAAPRRKQAAHHGDGGVRDPNRRRGVNDYVLGEMAWPEAKERLQETDLALLPVGAVEQHGPHLPLDIDAWDADYLARRVAAACSEPRPLVLPLIPYGVSYHHDDFSGTLSVSPETLSQLVYEIGLGVARQGITKLIIINGHGGNVPTLRFAAQIINRDAHIFTCVDTGDTSDSDVARMTETLNDVHAGEVETSTALATRPELVHMDRARKFVPRFSSQYLEFSSERSVEWYARTAKISPSGVLGDPTKATREKGEKIWQIQIDHLVAFVEALKSMTLDEIYERRY